MKATKNVDIEQLVRWTYQTQRADIVISRGVGLHEAEALADDVEIQTRSATALVGRHCTLGTAIDGGGFAFGASADVHPDAEAVHYMVATRCGMATATIIAHGRAGVRPSWAEGVRFRPVAAIDEKGRRVIAVLRDRSRNKIGELCPLVYMPDPRQVIEARNAYQLWHWGMTELAEACRSIVFRSHRLTGFAAPRRPWPAEDERYWQACADFVARLETASKGY